MKQPVTITHCEHCDAVVTLESPPSSQRYEASEIHIERGTILIPVKTVELRQTAGMCGDHAEFLNGYYCGPKCLAARLEEILNPAPSTGSEEE